MTELETQLEKLWIEYQSAVEAEGRLRDLPFLSPALPEKLAGFQVQPMTMRHVLALRMAGSAFFCGGTLPDEFDAFGFIWLLSPLYDPANAKRKETMLAACEKFMPPTRRLWQSRKRHQARKAKRFEAFMSALKEVQGFIYETFMDQPPSSGEGQAKAYYSDAAALVDQFGSEYGWTADYTLDLPLKVAFQLLKIIRARDRAKLRKPPMLFNKSDEFIAKAQDIETQMLLEREKAKNGRN